MTHQVHDRPVLGPTAVAAIGLSGLAAAMGIGRFAFTPLLPLMQAADGLTLAQGSWLALANYLGYLIGALLCWRFAPAPGGAARHGLLAVALTTVAMAATHDVVAWWLLRFGAGIASAYVLVGVSAWTLNALAHWGRAPAAGVVFSGVGVGIALAGLAGVSAGVQQMSPQSLWVGLGAAAAAVCVLTWTPLRTAAGPPRRTPQDDDARLPSLRLVLCYGALGLGYIIPATYLPAQARALIDDPNVFGWIWPAFGVAAAASTLVAARLFGHLPPRALWAAGNLVMAIGVVLAAFVPSVAALLVAAVCVGGTFMVITMAGMQEARRIGGAAAPKLMAAMTAAFAIGQLAGPLWIGVAADGTGAMRTPSLIAAAALIAATTALLRDDARNRRSNISGAPYER